MVAQLCTALLVVTAALTLSQPPHVATAAPQAAPIAAVPSGERSDFASFVEGLRTEALERGISADTVDRALTGLEPSPGVIERDQTQAELVRALCQWFVQHNNDHPAESEIKKRVSTIYNGLERGRKPSD